MAADGTVKIGIKITADQTGVQEAEKGLKSVSSTAKKAASETSGGFAEMRKGVGAVTSSIGALRNILTGFGVVGLITPIIAAFKAWREEITRAEERAKALREALALQAEAAQVRRVAEAYAELKSSIAAAAEERSRDNALFDENTRVKRLAEDAALDSDEANALAEIDPDDPDAEKKRQAVADRFTARRARTAAIRTKADVVFRRQKLYGDAETATAAADQLESSLSGDEAAIRRARTKAGTLAQLATMRNEKDGTWYNPRKRTEEGDAERDRLKKEAETARAEARRLEAEKAAKEKEIASLRAAAAHSTSMADALFPAITAADTTLDTLVTRERTAEGIGAAKTARDAKTLSDAQKAQTLLGSQKADLEAQIAAQRERKGDAAFMLWRTQGLAEVAAANGRGANASAALAAAQENAYAVDKSADAAIEALTETLREVTAKLNEATNYIRQNSKQTRNFLAESPAGD